MNVPDYGVATSEDLVRIRLTFRRGPDGNVLIEVANSGRLHATSLAKSDANPGESDITDIRAALDRHYPGRHKFSFTEDSFTARATLVLPLMA